MRYTNDVSDEPLREETTVVGLVDGLLLIKRERLWSDGARLGGDFMFDPRSAGWLADQLEFAAEDNLSDATYDSAPDHLLVYVRGGDYGQPININVHNRRETNAAHGKTYTMGGMSSEVARKLAAELRAFKA